MAGFFTIQFVTMQWLPSMFDVRYPVPFTMCVTGVEVEVIP